MGLEIDEAVDDLGAGALQVARPLDVGFLVEARLQLDHRGDRLAGLGRLDQGRDDRRVLAGPVQRLLDRDDRRIARRLVQELHHHVEALIRVVDDDVLGAGSRRSSRRRNRGSARESGRCRAGRRGRGARPRSAACVSTSPISPSGRRRRRSRRAVPARRNSRRSGAMPTLTASRITLPRRRRFSALSKVRTRSSASSSISISLSRRTRNRPCAGQLEAAWETCGRGTAARPAPAG